MKRQGYLALAIVGVAAASIAAYSFTNGVKAGGVNLQMDMQLTADEYEFIQYVTKYGKGYVTKEEFGFRAAQYASTKMLVEEKNLRTGLTYRLTINKFADWTKEEYRGILGYKKNSYGNAPRIPAQSAVKADLPKQVDWRDKNAVNYVQDQGQCGSCWAFSAVAAIEGHHAIKTGQLLKLSEQQLVDCAGGVYGNQGCDGGDMASAMNYTMKFPLETEDDYPYEEYDQDCQWSAAKGKVSVTAIHEVTPSNVNALLQAVAQGPVSVAIEADTDDFQNYDFGIFTGFGCGTDLDHGVTIVGYDITDGIDNGYYIVRNSWGDWGDQGYILMAIQEGDGTCGIQMEPVWPETN